MNVNTFHLDKVGLNRFFGPLESKIMDILWEGSEKSIKDVQQRLEKEKGTNFNTVTTVMNRLVKKEVLEKRIQGRKSIFKPTKTKEQFIEEQSKRIVDNIMEEFGVLIINHMFDSLKEIDQSLLDKLEQKIAEFKKID